MHTARRKIVLDAAGGADLLGPLGGSSMIEWWEFDETSGNATGAHAGHVLSDINTVGTTTGVNGNARLFATSANECFSLADHADFSLGADQSFTWAFRAKLTSTGIQPQVIHKASGTSSASSEYRVRVLTGGEIRLNIGDGSTTVTVTSTEVLNTSAFRDVRVWYDSVAQQAGVQIDVTTKVTGAWTNGTQDTAGSLVIGARSDLAATYDGALDGLVFWKSAISDTEWNNYRASTGYPG